MIMPYAGYALPDDDCIWYTDYDLDGYGNMYLTIEAPCEGGPMGWFILNYGGDFCDNDPQSLESCDGDPCINNSIPWFSDNDGDGYGDPDNFIFSCTIVEGYVPWPNFLDCDDNNASVGPGENYYQDLDGDGYGNPNVWYTPTWNHPYNIPGGNSYFTIHLTCEPPAGYVTDASDCDDNNPDIHPSAPDILCNGIDEDCNGADALQEWHVDYDGDGFVNYYITLFSCEAPWGWYEGPGWPQDPCDYDPQSTDGCDNQSCEANAIPWFADNDGDGWGDPNNFIMSCTIVEGYLPWPNFHDCDDSNPSVSVGAFYYRDMDGDGFGDINVRYYPPWTHPYNQYGGDPYYLVSCQSPPGYITDYNDCNDANANVHPGAQEICDGLDNDCNGLTDDDDAVVAGRVIWYQDGDNDGFGNADETLLACFQPEGYSGNGTDCDDSNTQVYPDAPEIMNGYDDDCDGITDEGGNQMNVEAGNCEVVYYGYSPQACKTLTVSVTGGSSPYTYTWSNGAHTQSIDVCPSLTTTYSVVVTDHNGATAEDNVTVQVIDVRCGNNNNKVLVCHSGNVICIASSAVPDHLSHGDYLGVCGAPDPCEEQSASAVKNNGDNESSVSHNTISRASVNSQENRVVFNIMPNPANDHIAVQTNLPDGIISVIDFSGQVIYHQSIMTGKNVIDTEMLSDGIYMMRVEGVNGSYMKSFVVIH
jgi:hypothetical protein